MIPHLALALAVARPSPPPADHWFGADKVKHFFIAAFTQTVAYSALQAARVDHNAALAGASVVTGVIAVGKEIHDRRSYGVFSVRDLVWDAAGAAGATLIIRRTVRVSDESGRSSPAAGIFGPRSTSLLSEVRTNPIFR